MQDYLEPIWQIHDHEKYLPDNSIAKREWKRYLAPAGNLTGQDRVRLTFHDEAPFVNLSETMIELHFNVKKSSTAASTPVALDETDGVMLPDGWLLMENVDLSVNHELVRKQKDPGIQHYMSAVTKYSEDYQTVADKASFHPLKVMDTAGEAEYYYATTVTYDTGHPEHVETDGNIVKYPWLSHTPNVLAKYKYDDTIDGYVPNGRAENPWYSEEFAKSNRRLHESDVVLYLPLSEAFPEIKQTLAKSLRGSSLEVNFNKNNVLKAFYCNSKAASATAGYTLHLDFTEAALWIPTYEPSQGSQKHVEELLATGSTLTEKYNHRQLYSKKELPASMTTNTIKLNTDSKNVQKVYVAIQLDIQNESLFRNPVQFEPMNLSSLQVFINGVGYPSAPYVTANGSSRFLNDVYDSVGLPKDFENGSIVDADSFDQGPFRIYVFDVSQMNDDRQIDHVSDVELRYTLSGAVSGTYTIHTLVESIHEMDLKMLGGKTKVFIK